MSEAYRAPDFPPGFSGRTSSLPLAARSRCWFLVAALLFVTARAEGTTVTIAWDPNAEPDLAGYIIGYGLAPGRNDQLVNVGLATQWTLSGLQIGHTYYFRVYAYNIKGVEERTFRRSVRGRQLCGYQRLVRDMPRWCPCAGLVLPERQLAAPGISTRISDIDDKHGTVCLRGHSAGSRVALRERQLAAPGFPPDEHHVNRGRDGAMSWGPSGFRLDVLGRQLGTARLPSSGNRGEHQFITINVWRTAAGRRLGLCERQLAATGFASALPGHDNANQPGALVMRGNGSRRGLGLRERQLASAGPSDGERRLGPSVPGSLGHGSLGPGPCVTGPWSRVVTGPWSRVVTIPITGRRGVIPSTLARFTASPVVMGPGRQVTGGLVEKVQQYEERTRRDEARTRDQDPTRTQDAGRRTRDAGPGTKDQGRRTSDTDKGT